MSAPSSLLATTLAFATASFGAAYVLAPSPHAPAPRPAAVRETSTATAGPARAPVGNGSASFVIPRAPDSHFYADAQVNGATVRFLVDTGASIVVLTPQDALNAGIGAGDFTASGVGAGGTVKLMPATATRLALGPLVADNVPVMVAQDGLPVSLLGQSYLSRIGNVSIEGDTMTLR